MVALVVQHSGRVGYGFSVITGGGGHDAALQLFFCQLADLVQGAPQLEGAGDLHAFRLGVHLAAR